MLKNNKGITLISLVITIIVILILGSISLFTIIDENGVLQNSKRLSFQEQVKMLQAELNEYILEQKTASVDGNYYSTLLNANSTSLTYNGQVQEGKSITTIFPNQSQDVLKNYEIKNGRLLYNGTDSANIETFDTTTNKTYATVKVGNTNLKTVQNLSTLYGETVSGFTSVEGIQWQLFYDDTDNIYLIASDYVPVSTLPSELYKESGNQTQKYRAWFLTYSNQIHSGIIIDNNPWKNGSQASVLLSNPLTSKYLKWVAAYQNSTNYNIRAVAFMMDTSKWSNFAGNVTGAYAMGGPTLEMFVLSYNAKHDVKIHDYTSGISSTNSSSGGYKIKYQSNSNTTWGGSINIGNSENNMWIKNSNDKAYAYNIASPSTEVGCLVLAHYNGTLGFYYGINGGAIGFRPLVAIPKSSLK